MKLSNVTLAQAHRLAAGLGRQWRAADEKRGSPEDVYFARCVDAGAGHAARRGFAISHPTEDARRDSAVTHGR